MTLLLRTTDGAGNEAAVSRETVNVSGDPVEVRIYDTEEWVRRDDFDQAVRYGRATYGVERYLRRQRDAYLEALRAAGVEVPRVEP